MYQRRMTSTRGAPDRPRVPTPPAGQRTAARRASDKPVSHRATVQVTLTWIGRGEPWIRIVTHEGEILRPGTMTLWELVLWCNGWTRQS